MKILIIGYYNLADGFLYGSKEFIKKNYNIYFFPFLNWKNNNYNNTQELFVNIQNINFDLIIWWYSSCDVKCIKLFNDMCKNYNISKNKAIIYNWDPILYHSKELSIWKNKIEIENNISKQKLIDKYFCVMPEQVDKINAIHILPGFSKELVIEKITNNNFDGTWEHFNTQHSYICDISFVITNLYIDENVSPTQFQLGNRKKIIDYFYKKRDKYNVHLYGIDKFKELYPEIYKGYISYEDCPNLFNKSKVNICYNISSFLNKNGLDYYSERLPQILGSGGLLISDCEYSSIQNNIHYIKITNNDFEKLENIINNIDNYQNIRKNGWEKAWDTMSWEKWSNTILNNI